MQWTPNRCVFGLRLGAADAGALEPKSMATGCSVQLNKQIGEYLVASELATRGLLVATFSGNVPDFDIIAADAKGNSIPIQVKTIRKGSWQFSLDKFVEVQLQGKKQILGSKVAPRIPNLLFVFVLATIYGKDRFFILDWDELQDVVISSYNKWIASKDGVRPRNYKSLHCAVSPEQLAVFEDQWGKITERL